VSPGHRSPPPSRSIARGAASVGALESATPGLVEEVVFVHDDNLFEE
jgi:hypothetical protein